jgi:hypothetical protein
MTGEGESKSPTSPHNDPGANEWKLSWGRFLQFAKNILDLERSVAALKSENKELRKDLHDL